MSKTHIEIRKSNRRNIIISIIRNRVKVSRYELKKISSLSMTTVLSIVDDLLKEGIIIESEVGQSTGGRKPVYLQINPLAFYIVGIEFNAEKLYGVIINFVGDVIFSKETEVSESESSSNGILNLIKKVIHEALNTVNISRKKFLGIGVGCPGYINVTNGVLRFYAHKHDWKNVHVKFELEKEFGLPTYVNNNLTATALAFKWLHPNNDYKNFILLSIRSGIRLSMFLNNQLFQGSTNTAGEIGHIPVPGSTRRCGCGKKGCLDSEASNIAIHTKILEGIQHNRFEDLYNMVGRDISKITIEAFVKSFLLGHLDSVELFDEICDYIGLAISTVVNLINPSRIIISGPITMAGQKLLQNLSEKLIKYSIFVSVENLSLEISETKEYINTLGAAMIVMQEKFTCEPEFDQT